MSENKQSDWKEREVGALWKKISNGNKANYCTGYIVSDELGSKTKQRVIMFSNKNKTNDKSPDFILYTSNEVGSQASPSFQKDVPKSAVTANVESDDDVPSM
jgi:hypothetical protein